ncbi:MAG: Rv0361 family membrane protein [Solirubrobacterales bacterium]
MTLDAPRMRLIALIAGIVVFVIVLILVLGGGGDEDDPAAEARSTAEQFVSTVGAGEFETACGLLTKQLAEQIGGAQCPDQLSATVGEAGTDISITVTNVRVSGPKAVAETEVRRSGAPPADSSLELVESDGEWQISRLGD